ncbi:SUMO1 sentrin specific peptidase 1 [Coemansia sp. RSA 1200]|nr:SUMO1 sentrin specific peptidase 1 [Coemansia sp. RSA 1200]
MQSGSAKSSSSRKRVRPVDTAAAAATMDMPGEFPTPRKVSLLHQKETNLLYTGELQQRKEQHTASSSSSNNNASGSSWFVSYLLTPLRAAKEWLVGGQKNHGIQKTPVSSVKRSRRHAESSRSARHHKSQKQQQQRRRRYPAAGAAAAAGIGGRPAAYRKSLFGKSFGNGSSNNACRSRNTSLVREYTEPMHRSWWPQTGTTAPSSVADDNDSVLSVDSTGNFARTMRSRQSSFVSSSTAATQPAVGLRDMKRITATDETDWILRLQKRIQETLAVSAPAAAATRMTLTPMYDRVCKEESELDARLEKARQKQAFVLPPDAPAVIAQATSPGFSAELNSVPVSAHDIATLGDGEWLNDEVINFYMQLITSRSSSATSGSGVPRCHAFNTFFFSTLQQGGYARVRRWTRRVALFEKDLVIVPVHLGVHWCCAVIDFRARSIRYYDALGGDNADALALLMNYLKEESRDKRKSEFDDSGWTTVCDKKIPRQQNGYDCGVFAITFAEYAARDAPFAFSQKNCSFLRRKVIYEIATGALISAAQ